MPDISIVIPLLNEEESLPELVAWIDRVMQEHKFSYEVLLVDDGSKDKSWQVITNLKASYPTVKGIKFRRNYGKSAALNVGFHEVQGDVVITMDADLQDSPDELPELYHMIIKDGFDIVSGWKKKRYDPLTKTIPTRLFNWATRKMSGIYLHDFNCGLKAYKREVVQSIEVFGEMHRYIPVIAKRAGFVKIGEKIVQHQARKYGHSKFGWERFFNGFLDLMSIYFLTRFGKKPMHFFGFYGIVMFFLGFLITFYLLFNKVYHSNVTHEATREVTANPLFYLSLLSIILGTQLFLAGFLGELISRSSADRNDYQVSETIGLK